MTAARFSPSTIRLASLGTLAGGALWGLFWIPIHTFEGLGFQNAWPGLVFYLSALVAFIPLLLLRRRPLRSTRQIAIIGLLTGTAFAFYGTSIILTDVVRALLFFYLTPVWGTAIGIFFLGERLTAVRVIAILMAFAGLFAVVGFGSRSAINFGDLLALASGLLWAIGSYKIYKLDDPEPVHLSVAFVLGGIIMTSLLILLAGDIFGSSERLPSASERWPFFIISALYALPMVFLTIWPAKYLSPGRIGILLMSEVVVGVFSVALFANEPFGPFEALGAALIIGATLVEVLGNRNA